MDKHNTLRRKTAALPNRGVCATCHEIIEWKKKYGKYKPLKVPGKCVGCGSSTVVDAYHNICQQCAAATGACAKCQTGKAVAEKTLADERPNERMPDAGELAEMNERQRRSALRKVEKAKKERKAAEKEARVAAEEAANGGASASSATLRDCDDYADDAMDDDDDDDDEPPQPQSRNLFTDAAANARRRAAMLAKGMAEPPKQAPPPPAAPVDVSEGSTMPPAPPKPSAPRQPPAAAGDGGEFEACFFFEGPRVGYAFKSGPRGVGYYRDGAAGGAEDKRMEQPLAPSKPGPSKPAAPSKPARSHLDDDDDAVAAVEAENVTEDEDDGEEGEEGEEEEEEEEVDDDEDDEDEMDENEMREQLDCLTHSAGARVLVMQGYAWIDAAHLAVAEAGFDALCERLAEMGGGAAAAADAMTDRICKIAELSDDAAMPLKVLDVAPILALAMLLELECYARVLPASYNADATDAERAARKLFAQRGGC